jgi:hypothetical protein
MGIFELGLAALVCIAFFPFLGLAEGVDLLFELFQLFLDGLEVLLAVGAGVFGLGLAEIAGGGSAGGAVGLEVAEGGSQF